ncbi:MAG TPA: hypothetical protein VLA48_03300 [Nitrososphaeraceae archaeon]|nr:hypothetical protein [Nitrososphaeraceae archaeon]
MVQSILDLNRETYLEKAEKNLLQMSDAYFFDKHFKIGEGVNEDKMSFYYQMHRLLCTDDCEMIEFIQDKIEGKLEDCGVKRKPKQTISEVMKIAEEHFEDKCCEVISDSCGWSSKEW